ncbi:MAG: metallophosphoesterase [Ktedonobacteraceae bacterium]|nr:metallophosphoesterase [Ktedonobacteraceae bacterium]
MVEHTVENDQEKQTEQIRAMQKQRREDVVTIVFTADNHLGYTASGQNPRKREERQQLLRRAFQQASDFAVAQGADLFIQAGDLFDTPTPDERDRSFVADCLAHLKEAGIRAFALGGVHDTPAEGQAAARDAIPAPQISYARLGALHYFPPLRPGAARQPEPVVLDIKGMRVGLWGLGVLAGQESDPLAAIHAHPETEHLTIPLLVLHAPIEGLLQEPARQDTRACIRRETIERQTAFRYILAGYHHRHSRTRIGQTEVIVAGSTQHIDFSTPDHTPGFVFLGLAADGIRWCDHIAVETLSLHRLIIKTHELWPESSNPSSAIQDIPHVPDALDTPDAQTAQAAPSASDTSTQGSHRTPTEVILDRLRPLCAPNAMVQLRLEGELTRKQYHELNLNQIRHYGEEHCFALAIDDSASSLLSESEAGATESGERFSPREELVALADEWIAASSDEKEKKALQVTKEEVLLAMDEIKGRW